VSYSPICLCHRSSTTVWGFTPFLEIFGVPDHNGKLQVPSSWQNGISGGTSVGEIIGLQFAGWAASRYGYVGCRPFTRSSSIDDDRTQRWTIMPALAAMIGFIFIPFFARSLTVLLIGEIFQGMSWGVFVSTSLYKSRPRLRRIEIANYDHLVRRRSLASRYPSLVHFVRQHVLVHWAIHFCRCPAVSALIPSGRRTHSNRLVALSITKLSGGESYFNGRADSQLSHPLRDPMGLAGSNLVNSFIVSSRIQLTLQDRHIPRPGVTLVLRQERRQGEGPEFAQAAGPQGGWNGR